MDNNKGNIRFNTVLLVLQPGIMARLLRHGKTFVMAESAINYLGSEAFSKSNQSLIQDICDTFLTGSVEDITNRLVEAVLKRQVPIRNPAFEPDYSKGVKLSVLKDSELSTNVVDRAEVVIDKYSLHKRLLGMDELIQPVESRSATKAIHFQEYSAMSNVTSVDYYDRHDLIVDDEGFVTFKPGAYPLGEDSSESEVAVCIVDGLYKLHGQSLDWHLAETRFVKRVQGQQPGWYHWEQIEELSLARGHGELHFRVVVKEGAKPWPKPTGLVNYYLNVSDRGTAVYHPDATDQEHRDIKDEFDEFKKSIQHMEKVGKDITETSSKRLSNLRIVK